MPKKAGTEACRICGGSMDGRPSTAAICARKDCERERNRIKAAKHGKSKLWGRPKKCGTCGSVFDRSQFRKKFCSDRCAEAGARKASKAAEARRAAATVAAAS